MHLETFSDIYQRAVQRKGGVNQLEARLSIPLTPNELMTITDDRWLAVFTQKVFQCGISWELVRKKWPQFEEVFFGFKPESLLMLSEEMWQAKAKDPRIIRHFTKVMTIPANAQMILSARQEADSFAQLVADWPAERITELWDYLKKNGKRLGGNTGAYSLRQLGKDTFILSTDVESYLRSYHIIDSGRDTQRAKKAANRAFMQWQQESGRSLTEISQIIAYSCGDNRV